MASRSREELPAEADSSRSSRVLRENAEVPAPKGSYNVFLEALQHSFPAEATCSMFCGGKKCKYCCAASWLPEDQAVPGLYSHWVTDKILAMSRPTTENMEKYGIIESFKKNGIKSIINLQRPGEHADCGNGLENNEFSYSAQKFMDNGVFFYNYCWTDYGSPQTFSAILDVVNVMQFSLAEGKVSVHCHAGLGRTGLLIACYFIYAEAMSASEAINFVRSRRPRSIQTNLQVDFALNFEQFLKPYRVTFSNTSVPSFTYSQFMHRQRQILHGYEGRSLKHIPKIIHTICERLLELSGKKALLSLDPATGEPVNGQLEVGEPRASSSIKGIMPMPPLSVEAVCAALLQSHGDNTSQNSEMPPMPERYEGYKKELSLDGRSPAWARLSQDEADPLVLAMLFWHWLGHLREPVVTLQDINLLLTDMASAGSSENMDRGSPAVKPERLLSKLKRDVSALLTYIAGFLQRLEPLSEATKHCIILCLVCTLTHVESTYDCGSPDGGPSSAAVASSGHVPMMFATEQECLLRFFYLLLEAKSERD